MKMSGTRSFDAPRASVWLVLNDPARMAKTMPGVENFAVQDDRHWTANVKVPLGLGGLRMRISFEKLEEREPDYARLRAKGNGVGALLSMETKFHLSDDAGGTAMRWEADVRVAGPVGSMGQRILQPIVNQQVQHVLTALDQQVASAADERSGAGEELDDAGAPAEVTREADAGSEAEGSSGAEEGISPWDEEAYRAKPNE